MDLSLPNVAGVIFDKDGTLFDFHATWGAWALRFLTAEAQGDAVKLRQMAEAIGYDPEGREFAPDSIVIAHTPDEIAAELVRFCPGERIEDLSDRMNDMAATAPQVAAPSLLSVLSELARRGMSLGVATNDAEAPARSHLAAAGVEGMFDFIAGYDSGFGGKPAPGQLLAFAEQIGAEPSACVMVGDSRHDLIAARAAGMRAVGVLTGLASVDDLGPLAEVVLPSIADLPDWLPSGS